MKKWVFLYDKNNNKHNVTIVVNLDITPIIVIIIILSSQQGGINFLAASGHQFSKILASRAIFEMLAPTMFIYTILNKKKCFGA